MSDVDKWLKKTYGEISKPARYYAEKDKLTYSVSPAIDLGLSGGVQEGEIALFSGPPKCGKTTTVLQIATEAQRLGRKVYYISAEHRFSRKNAEGVCGLNIDELQIIQSEKERVLWAEDFCDIAYNIAELEENNIIIFDSFSSLCTNNREGEKVSASTRSSVPKLLSDFCKQVAHILPLNNNTILGIQHVIANTSGYGPSKMEDSGGKIIYQSDIRMRCGTPKKWEESGKVVGHVAPWEVLVSSLGPPGAKVESYIRYGYGIDKEQEALRLMIETGIITKGGAWYQLEDEKIQGEAKVLSYFKENPKIFKKYNEELREILYG